MIKKLVATLLSSTILAIIPANVVACGPITSQKLLNREVDPNLFKTAYSAAPTTWNPVATMQSNDALLLANLQDTLLQNNAEGELVPDLLTDLGQNNDDSTEFTFTFRDDAAFFDQKGSKVKEIDADDFLNTAKFVLNPMNISQLINSWTSTVLHAKEINAIYTEDKKQNPGKNAYDVSNNPAAVDLLKQAIVINPAQPKTFTLKLTKPTPYFRSYLTSFIFSPIPTQALFQSYNYGIRPEQVWTTGPYLIKQYETSYVLKLAKNPAYFDAENVHIKQLWYQFSPSPDVARPRFLFETGDYSEVLLQPSDSYGWKKYVGSDFAHPKFAGLTKIKNPSLGTRYLSFNFFNTETSFDADKYQNFEGKAYEQGAASNVALNLDSVRTLITFAMDRSLFVHYFSAAFDDSTHSKFLRNTFNPGGYLKGDDQRDYQSYVEDAYNQMFGEQISLADGEEVFYHNKSLLTPQGNEIITDQEAKDLLANNRPFEALMRQVRVDLTALGYPNGVNLTMLMSGVYNSTWNIYIQDMIDTFNQATKNFVKLNRKGTLNDSDYQATQLRGNFSMFLTGWAPNFLDPLAFLRTYIIGGDMAAYFGLDRIITNAEFDENNQTSLEQLTINPQYEQAFNDQKYVTTFLTHFVDFTNQVNRADQITANDQLTQRYQAFAAAEADLLYSYKLLMPVYIPNGTTKTLLTYVDEPTRTHVGFGNSDVRFVGVKMRKSLKPTTTLIALFTSLELIIRPYSTQD